MSNDYQDPDGNQEQILHLLRTRRHTIPRIAEQLGLRYKHVYRVARASGINYLGRRLTREEKQAIRRAVERDGQSGRAIARQMGIPKTNVCRYVAQRRARYADGGGTTIRPVSTPQPRRCPRHGLLRLWPCVACAAEDARVSA